MLKSILGDIFLIDAGKTAEYLYRKNKENVANKLGNIKSTDIPDIFENKDSAKDVEALYEAFRERDELFLSSNLTSNEGSHGWSKFSIFKTILSMFRHYYLCYLMLLLTNVALSFYVKIKVRDFFCSFVNGDKETLEWTDVFPGLFLLLLQIVSIVFTTHCEYYGTWLHYKIQTAVSGSSILRFLECKRLRNKDGLCLRGNKDSTELLSLYQNIVLVDSEFTEYAISNSINILIYPLHVITSALVAHSIFGGLPLILCLTSLFTCFVFSVITQYLSSEYKRPFLKAREERLSETIELLEHSRYLSVTHQLFPSISKLIKGKRSRELRFNSYRKYICMASEIFDRWMILSCALTIGVYTLYNRLPPAKASLMLIQSVWLVPTFYHPLNDVILFVYYIIEGNISMERISNFLLSTRRDHLSATKSTFDGDVTVPTSSNSGREAVSVEIRRSDLIAGVTATQETAGIHIRKISLNHVSFSCGRDTERDLVDFNIDLIPGEPCFVVGKACSGKTALLHGICGYIYNTSVFESNWTDNSINNKGYFSLELSDGTTVNNILDISQYLNISYVPQVPWIPGGFDLASIITCGCDYDCDLWSEVIYQCDLEIDFNNWGIKTFNDASERIFTDKQFSTGQRVRLSLARAIYSMAYRSKCCETDNRSLLRSNILLVDCVLNSLDPFVCEMVARRLFLGKKGLLNKHFSIFVVEPPVLDSIAKASVSCPLSYKVVSMSSKTITGVEWHHSPLRDRSCSVHTPSDDENRGDGITNYLKDETVSLHSISSDCKEGGVSCAEREATKIDLVRNNYSYYYPSNYFYIFYAGSKKKVCLNRDLSSKTGEESKRSNFEAILMVACLVIPQIVCKLMESLLLVLFKEGNVDLVNWYRVPDIGFDHESSGPFLKFTNKILNNKILFLIVFKIPGYLGLNVLFFWTMIYNASFVVYMLAICVVTFLEIRIGLRAARYFHNSLLIGHLGATSNSLLKWLPTSFIMNRLSNDQLHLDYCITRRTRLVVIAINSMIISVIPSVLASSNVLATLFITIAVGVFIYNAYISYFTNSCRILRSCYVSEYSPLLEFIQTIGKGKKCITNRNMIDFLFKKSLNSIDSILKPKFAQTSIESWFKMRIKLLLTIPITLINIALPFVSKKGVHDSSTKSILALSIATTTGLIPLLSVLVLYWTKLETELVSVERCRLYLSKAREAGLEYFSKITDTSATARNYDKACIALEDVSAQYSCLDSCGESANFDNSYLIGSTVVKTTCLRGVTCSFESGQVVGIVGRTGSGKTTLLDILSNTLQHKDGSITTSGLCDKSQDSRDSLYAKLDKIHFPLDDFDSVILKTVVSYQESLSHVALLPLEVYCPKEGTVRDIVDPYGEYSRDNIQSALNICGFGDHIVQRTHIQSKGSERNESERRQKVHADELDPLISCNCQHHANVHDSFQDAESSNRSVCCKCNDPVSRFLESKLEDVKLGVLRLRMLLFVNFFLRRSKIKILLLDEPPVVKSCIPEDGGSDCILSSIIKKYFSHCITFIVSHDIRSLRIVDRIIVINNGRVIKDSRCGNQNLTNSELLDLVGDCGDFRD